MAFHPTPEQLAARSAAIELKPGEFIALNACAGSGKTTTVSFIAAETFTASHWRSLYICYNKEMATAAASKMGPHVKCSTVHSLAYGAVGSQFRGKLGNLRAREVMGFMRCQVDEARSSLGVINQFLCSDSSGIEMSHVVDVCGEKDAGVLRIAAGLWDRMCDVSDPVPMPHDGYLKLWVLSSPELSRFDLILVDESQDMNPCILSLVLGLIEKGLRVVFVGDTHQSLYGFRLAVDAMQVVSKIATRNLTLTESWRFPQHVADMATKVLKTLKGVDLNIVGRGSGRPDKAAPAHCTLARTNALLIRAAEESLRGSRQLHFAATKQSDKYDPFTPYRFQEILDVYGLYSGSTKPQTPHLAGYSSYGEFVAFAKGTEGDGSDADPELSPLADFVESYAHDTPRLLRDLSARSVGPDETDHHFSTGHRAKGKEWNRVTILDDFIPLDDPEKLKKWRSKHTAREFAEAANLLYVAVTRGRCEFVPPQSSVGFFSHPKGASLSPDDERLKSTASSNPVRQPTRRSSSLLP